MYYLFRAYVVLYVFSLKLNRQSGRQDVSEKKKNPCTPAGGSLITLHSWRRQECRQWKYLLKLMLSADRKKKMYKGFHVFV